MKGDGVGVLYSQYDKETRHYIRERACAMTRAKWPRVLICAALGVPKRTVEGIVTRYRENGDVFDGRLLNHRPRMIRSSQKSLIVDMEELQVSAHMTLQERCHRLKAKHGFHIKPMSLRRIYLQYGIKYRKIEHRMLSQLLNPEKRRQNRQNFAKRIFEYWRCNKRVYWLDQTSVHVWMKKSSTWAGTRERSYLPMQSTKGSNTTIMGAIDLNGKDAYFDVMEKNNSDCIVIFLTNLIQHFHETFRSVQTAVLVMDNYSAQKTDDVLNLCGAKFIEICYLPTYSSDLNPIELVWNTLKILWKKFLAGKTRRYRDVEVGDDVLALLR